MGMWAIYSGSRFVLTVPGAGLFATDWCMVAQAFGMKWHGVLQRAEQYYKVSNARYEAGLSTDLFIAANVVEQDAITAHLKWDGLCGTAVARQSRFAVCLPAFGSWRHELC